MVQSKSPIGVGVGSAGGVTPSPSHSNNKPENPAGAQAFGELLGTKLNNAAKPQGPAGPTFEGLRFSQHALERMANRGISFKPEDLIKLNEAVEKAAKKGSKESLVLMGDNALIVSVKNRTVVTAMDRETMKENVFTNIDSTVIL